jgi:Ca2+-binding RTX toxin-like protein
LEKAKSRSCSDTRTSQEVRRIDSSGGPVDANEVAYTTNDVYPSGPWGGVLRGTAVHDELVGEGGEDEVYGLGGDDTVKGGACDDKLYGGSGRDHISGDGRPSESDSETSPGKDILYGGDGNDTLIPGKDGQRDEVYCGKGKDVVYVGPEADKIDYEDDSCEKKEVVVPLVA